jgi:hypothetical protein
MCVAAVAGAGAVLDVPGPGSAIFEKSWQECGIILRGAYSEGEGKQKLVPSKE